MEKWLNLWIHAMMTNFLKGREDSIVVWLKAKEICFHITQGQENITTISDNLLL